MDVYHVAEILGRKFSSFKQLGNNPIGLSKYSFVTEILPNIGNFLLTDKVDGLRAFVVCGPATSVAITAADSREIAFHVADSVFDAELYDGTYYVFDVLELGGRNMTASPFSERLAALRGVAFAGEVKLKEYYKHGELPQSKEYDTDGIIFTSLDAGYMATKNYKWKPPDKITIDFLAVRCGDNSYQLYAGVEADTFRYLGVPYPMSQVDSRFPVTGRYIPVPFKNSLVNVCTLNTDQDIDGHIVEARFDANAKSWTLCKIREDKDAEIPRGNYGNAYKVAEMTLQSSLNPLTYDMLTQGLAALKGETYFHKSDAMYSSIRRFNNDVKRVLISRYRRSNIIDIGSGRGQDLYKYYGTEFRNIVLIEKDISAIDELVKRRHDVIAQLARRQSKGTAKSAQIPWMRPPYHVEIICADMNEPCESVVDEIRARFDSPPKFDVVFANFSLHYMMHDAASIRNIAKFVGTMARDLVFTMFDGKKVFDLIKDADWETKKYRIRKSATFGSTFQGGELIEVLLPCSEELRQEPLVRIETLDIELREYGMLRVEDRNFAEFDFAKKYKLDQDDRTMIGLYRCVKYKRM